MHERQQVQAPGPLAVLRGHGCDVQCIEPLPSPSPSPSLLASGDIGGNIKIWDLCGTMRSVFDSKLHPEPSAGVLTLQCMSQHSETVMMSSGRDGVIKLWSFDEGRGEQVMSIHPSSSHSRIETGAYSFCRPRGLSPSFIFHASIRKGCVDLWDTRGSTHYPSLTLSLTQDKLQDQGGMCMALSLPHGSEDKLRVLAGFEDGSLALWDLRQPSMALITEAPRVKRGHSEPIMCLDSTRPTVEPTRGTERLQEDDEEQGEEMKQRQLSQLIGSGSADDKICIWALVDDDRCLVKKKEVSLTQSDPGIADLAWSPDGRVLASAGWDGKIRLWSARGRQLAILRYHPSQATCVKIIPTPPLSAMHTNQEKGNLILSDQILASSSRDGTIALWSV